MEHKKTKEETAKSKEQRAKSKEEERLMDMWRERKSWSKQKGAGKKRKQERFNSQMPKE